MIIFFLFCIDLRAHEVPPFFEVGPLGHTPSSSASEPWTECFLSLPLLHLLIRFPAIFPFSEAIERRRVTLQDLLSVALQVGRYVEAALVFPLVVFVV